MAKVYCMKNLKASTKMNAKENKTEKKENRCGSTPSQIKVTSISFLFMERDFMLSIKLITTTLFTLWNFPILA